MAMSFEEAQRLTNQNLSKQRKGYLAENAYRQSPEGIQRSKDRVKAIGKGALEFTPYATYTDGKSAIENFQKGEYLDGSIDALFAAAAAVPGAMLAKKGIKSGYKGLKNLFKGPLSPQYNSKGAFIKGLMNESESVFNMLMKKLNPMYENANATLLTGQGGDIGKNFVKNNMGVYTQPKVSLSPKAAIADDYAMKQPIGDGSAGSGKRLLAFPYNQNEKFKDFTENTISNIGNSVVHGGPEVRIGPLALEKSTKNLIGKKPLSFPAASATYGRKNIPGQVDTPGNLGMLSRLSDDEFRNWASKNVFSKGGKVK